MDFLGVVNGKLDLEKQELRLLKYAHVDHGPFDQRPRDRRNGQPLSPHGILQFKRS